MATPAAHGRQPRWSRRLAGHAQTPTAVTRRQGHGPSLPVAPPAGRRRTPPVAAVAVVIGTPNTASLPSWGTGRSATAAADKVSFLSYRYSSGTSSVELPDLPVVPLRTESEWSRWRQETHSCTGGRRWCPSNTECRATEPQCVPGQLFQAEQHEQNQSRVQSPSHIQTQRPQSGAQISGTRT